MKYVNIMTVVLLLCGLSACEKELFHFNDSECLLNFNYTDGELLATDQVTDAMRSGSYSFKLNASEEQTLDTIWMRVNTMGLLSKENRPLALLQIKDENLANAEAGKHFVPFDDKGLAEAYYFIPANCSETKIPVVVKRDPSLREREVVLKFTFGENAFFKPGYPEFSTYTLMISDRLMRPSAWDLVGMDAYLGSYGEVKHELMIKWSEEAWDDAYIKNTLFYDYFGFAYVPKNESYLVYLRAWFSDLLEKENAERLMQGKEVYKEADGSEVSFTVV